MKLWNMLRTHDGIWFTKTGHEGLADIVDGAVLGPGSGYDGIEVLQQTCQRLRMCATMANIPLPLGGQPLACRPT